eukprot:4794224-Amphidinium_carterae.1
MATYARQPGDKCAGGSMNKVLLGSFVGVGLGAFIARLLTLIRTKRRVGNDEVVSVRCSMGLQTEEARCTPVSYTHLTLPTILLV